MISAKPINNRSHGFARFVGAVGLVLLLNAPLQAAITSINGVFNGQRVVFDVQFAEPHNFYGPWDFQLFIDSDDNGQTGYGWGFDAIVRGVAITDRCLSLRSTQGGSGPGGWGVQIGSVPMDVINDRHIRFEIRVGAGGVPTGNFAYSFEAYFDGRSAEAANNRRTISGTPPDLQDCNFFADCNFNGVPDSQDIANGTSQDCNSNGIPDECEPDCNASGRPDSCDIAIGFSEDCNFNGIPDECETPCPDGACPLDSDGDGVPDCIDVCPGYDDNIDSNGNGIPDACDTPADPLQALVFLRLEGDTQDATGNNHHGTWTGTPAYRSDGPQGGGAASFNGSAFITLANPSSINVAEQFTLAAWVRMPTMDTAESLPMILDTSLGSSPRRGYSFFYSKSQGTFRVELWNNGGIHFGLDTTANAVQAGSWYHLLLVFNSDGNLTSRNTGRFYVNGVLNNASNWGGGRGNGVSSLARVGLGGFVGDLADVAVWNRSLTEAEIQAVYQGTSTFDPCDIRPQGDGRPDCNRNNRADHCDIEQGVSLDCNNNGIPDECEPDCNGNGIPDECDIMSGTSTDCAKNGIPDECEADCNNNGIPDSCDVIRGYSVDCNGNGIPDECEPLVRAIGSRYLYIKPPTSTQMIALLVSGDPADPRMSCYHRYVQANGTLGPNPVFRKAIDWCGVAVRGAGILPNMLYFVRIDTGSVGNPILSAPTAARTWKRGDVTGDGQVDITDIVRTVDGFRGIFYIHGRPCHNDGHCTAALPHRRCDMQSFFCVGATIQNLDSGSPDAQCMPDGVLDITDVSRAIEAFRNTPSNCPFPCPAGS